MSYFLIYSPKFINDKNMKPTDFAKKLTDFLSKYLPCERGLSTNTIESYKTTLYIVHYFYGRKEKYSS